MIHFLNIQLWIPIRRGNPRGSRRAHLHCVNSLHHPTPSSLSVRLAHMSSTVILLTSTTPLWDPTYSSMAITHPNSINRGLWTPTDSVLTPVNLLDLATSGFIHDNTFTATMPEQTTPYHSEDQSSSATHSYLLPQVADDSHSTNQSSSALTNHESSCNHDHTEHHCWAFTPRRLETSDNEVTAARLAVSH